MQSFQTRDFDFVEILPPSSSDLREKVDSILDRSASWSAAIASLDRKTGTYKIVLQGRLSNDLGLRPSAGRIKNII